MGSIRANLILRKLIYLHFESPVTKQGATLWTDAASSYSVRTMLNQ